MTVLNALKALLGKQTVESPESPEDPVQGSSAASTRWVSSTKEARDSIKWLATTFGAAAAVAFGAGPILTSPTLDVSDWPWWRFVTYFGGGALAASGVVLVIWRMLLSLVPEELTLHDLPATFIQRIDQRPAGMGNDRLPNGIDTLGGLLTYMVAARAAISNFRQAAKKESNPLQKERLLGAAANVEDNLEICRVYEADLLDQAAYFITRDRVRKLGVPVLLGALLTVAGVSMYFLTVSETNDDKTGRSIEVAELRKSPVTAADNLWDMLELRTCESEPGIVPVLLTGGKGSPQDPFTVQTISVLPDCPSMSFNVISSVAEVVRREPTEHTITYTMPPK